METADLAAGSSLGSAGRAAGREEREQLHGGKGGNRPHPRRALHALLSRTDSSDKT